MEALHRFIEPCVNGNSAAPRSPVLRLGLARFVSSRQGHVELDLDWMLTRLLDRAPTEAADIVDALAGPRQTAALSLDDFGHVADADFLVRLLRGAAIEREAGINILIHGPPGTGKTELARTIAEVAGLALHAVGEADTVRIYAPIAVSVASGPAGAIAIRSCWRRRLPAFIVIMESRSSTLPMALNLNFHPLRKTRRILAHNYSRT